MEDEKKTYNVGLNNLLKPTPPNIRKWIQDHLTC